MLHSVSFWFAAECCPSCHSTFKCKSRRSNAPVIATSTSCGLVDLTLAEARSNAMMALLPNRPRQTCGIALCSHDLSLQNSYQQSKCLYSPMEGGLTSDCSGSWTNNHEAAAPLVKVMMILLVSKSKLESGSSAISATTKCRIHAV